MYDKLSQGKYVTETILSDNQNPLLLICLDIFLVHFMKQPTFVRISYVWLRKTKFQSELHVLGPVRPVPSNTCSTPWGTCTHIHTSRRNGVIQIQSPSLPPCVYIPLSEPRHHCHRPWPTRKLFWRASLPMRESQLTIPWLGVHGDNYSAIAAWKKLGHSCGKSVINLSRRWNKDWAGMRQRNTRVKIRSLKDVPPELRHLSVKSSQCQLGSSVGRSC